MSIAVTKSCLSQRADRYADSTGRSRYLPEETGHGPELGQIPQEERPPARPANSSPSETSGPSAISPVTSWRESAFPTRAVRGRRERLRRPHRNGCQRALPDPESREERPVDHRCSAGFLAAGRRLRRWPAHWMRCPTCVASSVRSGNGDDRCFTSCGSTPGRIEHGSLPPVSPGGGSEHRAAGERGGGTRPGTGSHRWPAAGCRDAPRG